MAKNRSNRMLKKLKIGAFQEFGFAFKSAFVKPLEGEAQTDLLISFLEEVIEKRGLALGGWINDGFVSKFTPGSATEEDRAAVEAWLNACEALEKVEVGGLVDAWYE
jgi:uncharacterized protein YggL (DUF469 family)